MEVKTKNDLKKLSLQELKIMCKNMKLGVSGTKTQLINKIWDYEKPQPIMVNSHSDSVSSDGKKIIGIKKGERDKYMQVGRQVEKGEGRFIYYAMDVHYYEVNKEFNFV